MTTPTVTTRPAQDARDRGRTAHVGDDADFTSSLALALADPDVVDIVVHPGVYVEQVVIAPRAAPLVIRSSTGRAADVTITFGLRQGDRGGDGMSIVQDCATLTVDADDVTLDGLTIENSFDKGGKGDVPDLQALALRTRGDRFTATRCRFVGQQDTVLLDAPSYAAVRRAHLLNCEIEGDVDFIYGKATALIEGGTIRSIGPGYICAPSTARENPRGFLFWRVEIVGDVASGSVKLGRPWHPGGKEDAVGQAIFARCILGPHISDDAWSDMGGYRWQDARLAEYGNTGPGAATGVARPQLDAAPDPMTWLAGWTPASVAAAPRIVIASDSTASEYTADRAPRAGWGEHLAAHTGCEVRNLAISGASSRSFIALGALDRALELLRPGDLLLIAFGHNDPKRDHRFSDVFTQYEANLRRYLVGARARGAQPVLFTPVASRLFVHGRARSIHGGYPERVRALAAAESVPLVDLTTLSRARWQELGEEGSKDAFLWLAPGQWPGYPDGEQDDTHFSEDGADLVAQLVADALRAAGLLRGAHPSPSRRHTEPTG